MSNIGAVLNEFPEDNVKRVVWLIGERNKNRHYNSTAPLVDILLVKLNDRNKVTGKGEVIKINISELDTARVGTIWVGKQKIDEIYTFNKQCSERFSFNLPKNFKSDIKVIARTQKITPDEEYPTIPPYTYPIWEHLPSSKEQQWSFTKSRLTILKSSCGVDVLIPAFELFTSTYAFGNKQIRNDLISLSMQDVTNKYVKYKCVDNDIFNIELTEPKSKDNTIFLAHLAMNIEARKRVSCISSAVQTLKTNFDIYPYHVERMMIDCDGVWLDSNHSRLLVLRINGCSLPNEYKIRLIDKSWDIEEKEDEQSTPETRYFDKKNPLPSNLPTTSESDPKKRSGAAYHLSEVNVIGDETFFEIQQERESKVVENVEYISLPDEKIEKLSSGESHYGEGSNRVGKLKSSEKDNDDKKEVENSAFLDKIKNAFESEDYKKHFFKIDYYDENLIVSDSYKLGSIDNRLFLLAKITDKEKRTAFVLEFDRGYKLNNCRGLLFNTDSRKLSSSVLLNILQTISDNDFKYISKEQNTGKMKKLVLPVRKKIVFKHKTADEDCFESKYILDITSSSAKKVFV